MAKKLLRILIIAVYLTFCIQFAQGQHVRTDADPPQDDTENLILSSINFDDIIFSADNSIRISPNRYAGVSSSASSGDTWLTRFRSLSYPNSLIVGYVGTFDYNIYSVGQLVIDFARPSSDVSFWWGVDGDPSGTIEIYNENLQLVNSIPVGFFGNSWHSYSLNQYHQKIKRVILRRPSVPNNLYGHIFLENFQFTPSTTQGPIGYLDGVSADPGAAFGWSLDPDNPSASNSVDCYVESVIPSRFIGRVVANNPSPDVPHPGNHRFSLLVPAQYRDGTLHQMYCYGIDFVGGDSPTLLTGSPKPFNLAPIVQSVVFEPVTNQIIGGILSNSQIDYPSVGSPSQRIFLDKHSPDDTTSRKVVRVKAVVGRPNVTVHFRNFDVDDLSADGTIDENGVAGNDNRDGRQIGLPYPPTAAGTLSSASAVTNANGEAIVYFSLTKQPGDNFVVAASTDATYANGISVAGTGLKDSTNAILPTKRSAPSC